jgi:transposase
MTPPLLPPTFELQSIQETGTRLELVAQRTETHAICPVCHQASQRVHSRYTRVPDDLAITALPVKLHLRVRRYRCANPHCPRATFAASCEELLPARARRTSRLRAVQSQVALALGGEAGSRLLTQLQQSTSPDTLLRLIRALPIPPPDTPRVLGVDDFSFRRGCTFGTILVDLEQHRVVDLLEDRDATSFARWLIAHPGVEIITRDRSAVYAQGATEGAPNAVQVADRWHILKNLGDAVERWLRRHGKHLKNPAQTTVIVAPPQQAMPLELPATNTSSAPAPPRIRRRRRGSPKGSQIRRYVESHAQRAKKLEVYERVVELHDAGHSARGIARMLGMPHSTVMKWLARGFPSRKVPGGILLDAPESPDLVGTHLEYLQQRLDNPEVGARQVYEELLERGYTGSHSTIGVAVAAHRAGFDTLEERASPSPRLTRYTPKMGVGLFLRRPEKLEDIDVQRLALLEAEVPVSKRLYALVQGFAAVFRNHEGDVLDRFEAWMIDARASGIAELVRFVRGVERDRSAVLAGLRLPWSNGQVEGQVTRLKFLKRQGYGRSKFDLLRSRVLLA